MCQIENSCLLQVRSDAAAMMPPTPILRHGNWPLLEVTASMFEGKLAGERAAGGAAAGGTSLAAAAAGAEIGEADLGGDWGDDELALPGEENGAAERAKRGEGDDEDGGWEMEVRLTLLHVTDLPLPLNQGACGTLLWARVWALQLQAVCIAAVAIVCLNALAARSEPSSF
jgi:Coatomer (COPI) alpha subunit C-terminus